MSRQILTDSDRIDALENKCALLAASLRHAEADGAAKLRSAAILALDCANGYTELAEWSRALFASIQHFARQDGTSANIVRNLAGVGFFVAEQAECQAEGFGGAAEQLLDACHEERDKVK